MKGSHDIFNIFARILSCIIIQVPYITIYGFSRNIYGCRARKMLMWFFLISLSISLKIIIPLSCSRSSATCTRSLRDIDCFIFTVKLVRSLRVTILPDSIEICCCNIFLLTFIASISSALRFNGGGSHLCFGKCCYKC